MTQRLRLSRIDRVAFVDKGDNPEADVVIHKRAETDDAPRLGLVERTVLRLAKAMGMDEDAALAKLHAMGAVDFDDVEAERRLPAVHEEIEDKLASLASALHRTLEAEDGEKASTLTEAARQFVAFVDDAAPRWAAGETVEKHEDPSDEDHTMPEQNTDTQFDIDALPEEHRAAVQSEIDRLTKLAESDADEGDDVTRLEKRLEALEKAGDTETAEIVKDALAQAKAAHERAEATEERLTKLEDERERERFVTKARSFKHLPNANPDDFGPLLRKAAGALDADEFDALEKTLRAADRAIADGEVYREIGSGAPTATDVEKRVESMAAELRKGDASLTKEQAIARVYDKNPELYDELTAERSDR